MGTNFYLKYDYCPCCGKPRKEKHLGKRSGGWKFLIHKDRDIYSMTSLIKFIVDNGGNIEDEYGNKYTDYEFTSIIAENQDGKPHPNVEHIGGYDFLAGEFC